MGSSLEGESSVVGFDPYFDEVLDLMGQAMENTPPARVLDPSEIVFVDPFEGGSLSGVSDESTTNSVMVVDRDLRSPEKIALIHHLLNYMVGYTSMEEIPYHVVNLKRMAFHKLYDVALSQGFQPASLPSLGRYLGVLMGPTVVPKWFHEQLIRVDVRRKSFPSKPLVNTLFDMSQKYEKGRFQSLESTQATMMLWARYCVSRLKYTDKASVGTPCLMKHKTLASGARRSMWTLSLPTFREYLRDELSRLVDIPVVNENGKRKRS